MALAEDVARTIVRKRRGELEQLPEPQRRAVVNSILKKISTKSDDELISFISTREPTVTPETTAELERVQEHRRITETGLPMERFGPGAVRMSPGQMEDIEREAELQRMGVETDAPLPAGDIELGFGVDPVESLKSVLSEHFKKPVTVFRRGEDILYIDPETQVAKRAEPNLLGSIGPALVVGGDITGTVGGGALAGLATKSPAGVITGESVGATAGTGAGEYLRLLIGKGFGVHDLSQGEMLKRAGAEGVKAGAATAVVGGAVGLGKGVKNFLKGRIFTHEEALRHGLTSDQAEVVISEVNKILGKKSGVKGTLFTRTGDVAIGAKEAEIRRNIKHAADFIERDIADQKALTEAANIITQPKAISAPTVGEVAARQVTKRLTQAKKVVSKNTTQFKEQLASIGRVRKEMIGEPTRQVIQAKSQAAKNAVDNAWETVRKAGGFKEASQTFGIDVPLGKNTKSLHGIMQRRMDSAVTPVTKRAVSKVFVKGGKKPIDLADYNREISDLKSQMRAARKNKQFGDPQIKDLDDVITAMEADRRLALVKAGKKDLLEKIEKAETDTAKFHEMFNRSTIGDLTAKNEKGIFNIKSKEFVDKTLKGTGEEADQLIGVIGDNPKLMTQWKEGIADAYKRKAFRDGKFNRVQSDQFLEGNADVLNRFFTPNELTKFKATGNLAETVKKQSDQLVKIIKNADSKFGRGKLKSLDPDNLVKFVTKDTGSFVTPGGRGVQSAVSKIKFVKNITRNQPASWRRFQSDFSESLRKDIFDPETGFIKPDSISNAVHKNADVIKQVMGDEYHKNLLKVNNAVQLFDKKPIGFTGDEVRAGVIQAIRAGVAPPLTRRGRAFTAMTIFERKEAHDAIAKALLDPSSMKKVADLAQHKRLTREMAELAVSLGLVTPDISEEE